MLLDNFKDYNNKLESILEKKDFSENAKNLLLSMLYKIENTYNDYQTVKRVTLSKNQYMSKILMTVNKKCRTIVLVNPGTRDAEILGNKNYILDRESGKIVCYHTEKTLLEAIFALSEEELDIDEEKYPYLKMPMNDFFHEGYRQTMTEVIRDFSGWSWDTSVKEMSNISYNIIFQSFLLLFGTNFMRDWFEQDIDSFDEYEYEPEDDENYTPGNSILSGKDVSQLDKFGVKVKGYGIDYIERMQDFLSKKYGALGRELYRTFERAIVGICMNNNDSEKERVFESAKKYNLELAEMQDKMGYIKKQMQEITKLNKRIEVIDKLLGNPDLLRKEYVKENSKRDDSEKYFSVGRYMDSLDTERQNIISQIEKINSRIKPDAFLEYKSYLENKVEFLSGIKVNQEGKVNEVFLLGEFLKRFFDCYYMKVDVILDERKIKDMIYEVRYFLSLPVDIKHRIRDIASIQNYMYRVEYCLIMKACLQKILMIYSSDEQLNYQIISSILKNKMVSMEKLGVLFKFSNSILEVQVYDGKTHETNISIPINGEKGLTIKLNRKVKFWL